MRSCHPQVNLAYGDEVFEVDAGIADLLHEIWLAPGMCTLFSCQDIDGLVWIEFLSGEKAAAFLKILLQTLDADPNQKALRNRIMAFDEEEVRPGRRAWQWTARPWDLTEELLEDVKELHPEGSPTLVEKAYDLGVSILVAVSFPIADYEDVLGCVRAYNENLSRAGGPETP
jgi:hypothetical protein